MGNNAALKRQILDRRNFVHGIIDLWIPDIDRLHVAEVIKIVKEATRIGKLRAITIKSHSFGPNAFSIFALLGESHIAIHTWPEYEYVAWHLQSF